MSPRKPAKRAPLRPHEIDAIDEAALGLLREAARDRGRFATFSASNAAHAFGLIDSLRVLGFITRQDVQNWRYRLERRIETETQQ